MRLAHAADRVGLPLSPPIRDERRQPAHHVEEMPRQGGERAPPALSPILGRLPDQGSEHRQQRHGQYDDNRTHPVEDRNRRHDENGQHHCADQRRQEPRHIRLDTRDPLSGKGARTCWLGRPVDRLRQPPSEQALPQGCGHPYAGPCGIHLREGSQRGPDDEHGPERDESWQEAGSTRHTEADDRDHDGRDGERLGDRGEALADAQRPEARHDAADLGEGLEDPWVDRSHEPDAR